MLGVFIHLLLRSWKAVLIYVAMLSSAHFRVNAYTREPRSMASRYPLCTHNAPSASVSTFLIR